MADAFVDTSFVVALINKGDEHHLRALDLASEFERPPLITTDAVLLEIGNALAKSFRAASIQVIDDFLTSSEVQIVHLYPDLFQRAFSLYRSRLDKTWGLVDCVSFVVMHDAGNLRFVDNRQTLRAGRFPGIVADVKPCLTGPGALRRR